MSNALLKDSALPPFQSIEIDQIKPAVQARIDAIWAVLKEALARIDKGEAPTWDNFVAPFEEASDLLEQTWSPVSHLNGVQNSDELREVYTECIQLLTEFSTAIDQHQPLYEAYKALADSAAYDELSQPQRTVIDNALRDFRLAGVALPEDKKQRYAEIRQALSELSNQFSNNVLDATQSWHRQFDKADALAGLPDSALAGAQQAAKSKELQGYVITLDIPSYLAVMTYANNRELREEVYTAYATRAGADSDWDNSPLIDKTLKLRKELAELLGFANFAEYSLATKMADKPQQVVDFLLELAEKSLPVAKQDLAQLQAFAREEHGIDELQAWDLAYYSELLKQRDYAVAQEELKPYFPADTVIQGMFTVVNKLFGIDVVAVDNDDLYHPDVQFFAIQKNGQTLAHFYLDIYARDKKRGGAWMADCRTRRFQGGVSSGALQLPVAFLTCNFTPPTDKQPSLLTHNEVTTLFHEFGHGLHHMLTQMTAAAVSGIAGVAWDAVELPSQFLENWCWEKSVIPLISGHYKTGEPLPEDLLDKMLAAKNFQSGMQMVRQLEFALFDMRIHSDYSGDGFDVQAVLDEVREQVAVMIPPAFNKFQNSFSHIFAGGYAAGYYSYKWAEVLSADAYSLFEEKGIFDQATGEKFLNTVLANGGSQPPAQLFEAFRGREANTDALLRHSGIAA